jgi:hypothetical protein
MALLNPQSPSSISSAGLPLSQHQKTPPTPLFDEFQSLFDDDWATCISFSEILNGDCTPGAWPSMPIPESLATLPSPSLFRGLDGLFSDPQVFNDPSSEGTPDDSTTPSDSQLCEEGADSSSDTGTSMSLKVLSNNKRAVDAKWDGLLAFDTAQLNRYVRNHPELTSQDVLAIKQARRRHKSRGYSAKARLKRGCPSPSMHSADDLASPEQIRKLLRAREELQQAQERVNALLALAALNGIVVASE